MKKFSSRFTMAVHTLTFIAHSAVECTADSIAESVKANPVVIRNILAMLKKAGIVGVRSGVGGAYLKKEARHISLLDIYHAVDLVEDDELFHFHKPHAACHIGQLVETALRTELAEAQAAMEQRLKQTTIQHLLDKLKIS